MLISTKGRYALRVMAEIAADETGEYVPLAKIAEDQNISMKYLESSVVLLSKAGLLDGKRGKNGGYRLNRKASEYTVAEILEITEGGLAPVTCLEGSRNLCARANTCITLPVWEGLNRVIKDYLESITLEDIEKQKAAFNIEI